MADIYGEEIVPRAARLAVRQADDGELIMTAEELEIIEADIMLGH
jgi:hypothetical protein